MSKFADIQTDPAIVRRAARGDIRAHEIIYRSYAAAVYSLCLRFTKMPAQAEDLVQDTFMEVMRSIGSFRGDAALGTWIRRIAVSKALMFLRSAWTARGQSLGEDWEEQLADGSYRRTAPDEALDLESALERLPDVARAVVWLHDVEGFTHREIAEHMGRSESFSKSQLSRAYRKLRPMLDGQGEQDEMAAALRSL